MRASWPAIAAWGGGLIQLALGAGAMTHGDGDVALLAAGGLLFALGLAALLWGTVVLARGRVAVAPLAVVGALASVVLTAVASAIDPGRMSILAAAPAIAMITVAGAGAAIAVRSRGRTDSGRRTPSGRRHAIGLIVAGVVAASIVTPALSATEAGFLMPTDGSTVLPRDIGHNH